MVVNLFGDAQSESHIPDLYLKVASQFASGSEYAIGFSFPSSTFHRKVSSIVHWAISFIPDKAVTDHAESLTQSTVVVFWLSWYRPVFLGPDSWTHEHKTMTDETRC